jgi:tetratricopeptide (TPR) repeat protein
MGEVWGALHTPSGAPVAVKVLTAKYARHLAYLNSVRLEVQAIARLHHPSVVSLYDFGRIDAKASEASEGRLVEGSPYLAMERVEGGSLSRWRRQLPWEQLRGVLLHLLDALAHAHARGVIHRDLKPANVLMADVAGRWVPKLTDFGIAHASGEEEREGEHEEPHGTPEYMAPEQLMGQWRDQGPWTDLYALGCVVFEMVLGDPPFRAPKGSTVEQRFRLLYDAHLREPMPVWAPPFAVPTDLRAWVKRLLAKSPEDRFLSAADAAWALRRLDGALLRGEGPRTVTLPAILSYDALKAQARASGEVARFREGLPPMPADWTREEPKAQAIQGVGLGLHGIRTLPLVGRERERDAIWAALRAVREDGQPRCVVLRGPAGSGKSALAEWMAERAQETGAALVLRAGHGPAQGGGLARLVMGWMGAGGLPRPAVYRRAVRMCLRAGLDDEGMARALTEIALDATPGEGSGLPQERRAVLHRWLGQLGRERPVLVWLDDVQWGLEGIKLVAHVLEAAEQAPVLFLLTARNEALAERPAEWHALTGLTTLPWAARLDVEPLGEGPCLELLEGVLGLAPDLAREVAARTGGNPLFAVQVVGDWAQRGALQATPKGFRLVGEQEARLPDSLHEAWAARVERLLSSDPLDGRPALELAATLGARVDRKEWEVACQLLGVVAPARLLESLVRARLAVEEKGGWAFTHAMLREALLRMAEEGGRAARWHHACALALLRLHPEEPAGVQARVGRHLLGAGMDEDAIDPLLAAAREARVAQDSASALAFLDLRDGAMQRLDVPALDRRRCEGWEVRAGVLAALGRYEEARDLLRQVWALARAQQWTELQGRARQCEGYISYMEEDLDSAQAAFTHARELFTKASLHDLALRCTLSLGDVAYYRPDLVLAQGYYEEALRGIQASGAESDLLRRAWSSLGDVLHLLGALDLAEQYQREALAMARAQGSLAHKAAARNALAEIARSRGDLVKAEREYREIMAMLKHSDAHQRAYAVVNVALVLAAQERFSEVEELLEQHRAGLEASGMPRIVASVAALDMVMAAHAGRAEAYLKHRARLEALQRRSNFEVDFARLWEQAAGYLAPSDPGEARLLLGWALEGWRSLRRADEVGRLEARVEALGGPQERPTVLDLSPVE